MKKKQIVFSIFTVVIFLAMFLIYSAFASAQATTITGFFVVEEKGSNESAKNANNTNIQSANSPEKVSSGNNGLGALTGNAVASGSAELRTENAASDKTAGNIPNHNTGQNKGFIWVIDKIINFFKGIF